MLSRFKLVGLLFLIIPEKILLNSGVHNNKEKIILDSGVHNTRENFILESLNLVWSFCSLITVILTR